MNCCNNDLFVASRVGHLDCVKYLLEEKGFTWSKCITYHAAFEGHVHILQYAQEKGLSFDPFTTIGAEKGGIDCLKWCIENNYHWRYDYQFPYRSIVIERLTIALEQNEPWWSQYILNLDLEGIHDIYRNKFQQLQNIIKINIRNELVHTLSYENDFLIKDIVKYDLAKYI